MIAGMSMAGTTVGGRALEAPRRSRASGYQTALAFSAACLMRFARSDHRRGPPRAAPFRAPLKKGLDTVKKLLLATAFAVAFTAPTQAELVSSACARQGQALGYATGNRYLGYRYDRDCQVLTPLPRTTTAAPSPRPAFAGGSAAKKGSGGTSADHQIRGARFASATQNHVAGSANGRIGHRPDAGAGRSSVRAGMSTQQAQLQSAPGRRETQEQAATVCQREWLAMPEEKRNQHLPADGEPRLSRSSLDWFYQKLIFQCLMRSIGAQDFVDLEIGLRAQHAGMCRDYARSNWRQMSPP